MISQVPRGHVVVGIDSVDDIAILVDILSSLGANSHLSLASVISVEELQGMASSYDSGPLIVQ